MMSHQENNHSIHVNPLLSRVFQLDGMHRSLLKIWHVAESEEVGHKKLVTTPTCATNWTSSVTKS